MMWFSKRDHELFKEADATGGMGITDPADYGDINSLPLGVPLSYVVQLHNAQMFIDPDLRLRNSDDKVTKILRILLLPVTGMAKILYGMCGICGKITEALMGY